MEVKEIIAQALVDIIDRKILDALFEAGKKAGIKEVVEWLKENEPKTIFVSEHIKYKALWQAQLKDWGINPN